MITMIMVMKGEASGASWTYNNDHNNDDNQVKPLDANGQQERGTDFMCDQCGYASVSAKGLAIHMGLGKCKRNVKENLANGVIINNVVNGTPGVNNGANGGYESEDEEVSFSPRLGEEHSSSTSCNPS